MKLLSPKTERKVNTFHFLIVALLGCGLSRAVEGDHQANELVKSALGEVHYEVYNQADNELRRVISLHPDLNLSQVRVGLIKYVKNGDQTGVPEEIKRPFDSLISSLENSGATLNDDTKLYMVESLTSVPAASSPETPAEPSNRSDESKTDPKQDGAKAESEAEKAAKERAAQKRAAERERLRDLERRQEQEALAKAAAQQQGGGSGGGRSGGGNSGGGQGGGGNSSGLGNNGLSSGGLSQSNFSNDAIDRLANRIGGSGNQGFANFSNFQNSSKKDDDKKNNFSLEPSKSKFDSSESLLGSSLKDKKPGLPQVQGLQDSGDSEPFQGSPMSVMSSQNSPASKGNGSTGSGFNGNGLGGGGGAGNQMMGFGGGAMAMGGSMVGSGDFPFSVTGEATAEESEYEEWPRFRVMNVAMTSSGGGEGGTGSNSFPDYSSSASSSSKGSKKGPDEAPFLYFVNSDEQALREVPGIFRSLAAGYRKTRVQNLCSQISSSNVGICHKMGRTSKNNLKKELEG